MTQNGVTKPRDREMPDPPEYNPDTARDEFHRSQGRYGRMYTGDYDWDAVKCTREAYGQGRGQGQAAGTPASDRYRSVHFHTDFLPPETAAECIKEIGRYNHFDPGQVNQAINSLPSPVRVAVAREGSPCLYIWTDRPGQVAERLRSIHSGAGGRMGARRPDTLGTVDTYPSTAFIDGTIEADGWTLVRAWWD